MLKRSVTLTILIALLTFVPPAAYVLWSLQQQTFATVDAERGIATQADAIAQTLVAIGTTQQGYVAPGQLDEPLFEEARNLLARLDAQVNAFAAALPAEMAATHLEPLRQSVDVLKAADERTRQNLARGQELMAADVIYADGRNVIDGIRSRVRDAQTISQAIATAAHARTARWMWVLFSVVVLGSAAALAALIRFTRHAGPGAEAAPVPEPAAAVVPSIDHTGLAALSTAVARAADVRALERALDATARLLDASSVMLWMNAGDRLFPALAHGSDADGLPRLKPIPRDAENAAADAWRTSRVVTQQAGAMGAGAAIVAPLFSPEAVIGVLAIELRPGRNPDADRSAAAAVIAAQLAMVVSAWPAASVPESVKARTA